MFRLLETITVEEIGSELLLYEHIKTGLRLVWLKRDEENMTFAITFETLPEDSTGVFHILEHSVLCGSKKYPVKEPFVELLKNSMNTFLNAMTFQDKTMYPVSSKNEKDFMNLMSVYLDAVFNPAIYHKEEIFAQEGWHLERGEDGEFTYKGVVFNEMKGAFADSDELIENAMCEALFPDTPYAFCSGGDPTVIPTLTYEAFLDAHRKYYAPTNGIIYLDGAVDIDKILDFIDREYLSDASMSERVLPPALQKPINGGTRVVPYEIGAEDDPERRTIYSYGAVACDFSEREKQLAIYTLTDVLADNNESYLPKIILERGLAEDVYFRFYDGISQPWLKLEVKNCRREDVAEIKKLIFDEMTRLASEGIEKKRIYAALANNEFIMNERDFGSYPQGLFLGIQVMEGMLYGGRPEQNLEVTHHYRKLNAEVENGYFEKLLREVLLDNIHSCEVILEPSKTLGEERRAAEEEAIRARIASMSEDEVAKVLQLQDSVNEWQASEDSPEALKTLPHLAISDIDEKPEKISCEVSEYKGITVLRHNIETAEIRHVSLYFELDGLDEESLAEASFVSSMLGNLGTSEEYADEVILKTQLLTGRFNAGIKINNNRYSSDINSIMLFANFSTLDSKLMEASQHVADIILNTDFSNKDTIGDILKQSRQELMESIIMGGHALASMRVGAMYSACDAARDAAGGYGCYTWLKKLEAEWDSVDPDERFTRVLKKMLSGAKLTISITAGESFDETELVKFFASKFPAAADAAEGTGHSIKAHGARTEGLAIPADIAFAVRGANVKAHGGKYSATLKLASRILSLAYLWNEVRVKGGAYGSGMKTDRTGMLSAYSYRDPNASKSLDTYAKSGEFLKNFLSAPGLDLTGFIVGAVSDASPLMTSRIKGNVADGLYMTGITYEELCNGRKELLKVTPSKLLEEASTISECMINGGTCVVGSKKQLKTLGTIDEMLSL